MVVLIMAISSSSIGGYSIDGYWCLLLVIILMAIDGYFVIKYWWLLMVIILLAIVAILLMAIGEYFIADIGGY